MMKQVNFSSNSVITRIISYFEGTIDSGNLDDFMNAYKYFRSLYKKIEKEDIDDFSKKYRDSDLEKEDLINFFKE